MESSFLLQECRLTIVGKADATGVPSRCNLLDRHIYLLAVIIIGC